jgi:uncharacterized protein (TIGR03790 family)
MIERRSNTTHQTSTFALAIGLLLGCAGISAALEPNEILILVNASSPESIRLAKYYCQKRGVPDKNVFSVSLGETLRDSISRRDYDNWLAGPLRRELLTRKDGDKIRCLLTTYGVPFRVGRCDPPAGAETRLKEMQTVQQEEKAAAASLEARGLTGTAEYADRTRKIAGIQMDIDRLMGIETDASVDSELSMLLCAAYDFYRWQPNFLCAIPGAGLDLARGRQPYRTLMVSRLDGPGYGVAKGLVDKALTAEAKGLAGSACIDSRGLASNDAYGQCDQLLRALAVLTAARTKLPVKEETTAALFAPGSCPRTALYCGWYSVKQYVPAFEFVDGAVGFHIASFEAQDLRNPRSTEWCPAMLMAGITATLGPVAEPYLHAFPPPNAFFSELFDGKCLVDAYYRTNPYNSWQMLLIGDPLYRPFKKN